jgi:hypothetical protein
MMDERQLAVDLYNGLWPLLEKRVRTSDEDAQLVHQAHASLYHWSQVGEQVNLARGSGCARGCMPCWAGLNRRSGTRVGP